jgi:hypothetical protein
MLGVTRDEVLKRCADFSGQLSTQCRTLGVGILAFAWALMTSKDSLLLNPATKIVDANRRWHLLGISCLAIGALFADLIQYYAGLKSEVHTLKKFDNAKSEDERRTYDVSFAARIQDSAFFLKLLALGIAAIWLIGLLGSVWFAS